MVELLLGRDRAPRLAGPVEDRDLAIAYASLGRAALPLLEKLRSSDDAPALVRLASYVAAGVVTGFLARRLRLMLAQSLFALEELADIAYGRIDWASLESERTQDRSPDRV